MEILKNILLTIDFSESSEFVIDTAIDLAKVFHSEITLIYVMPKGIGNSKAKELLNEFSLRQLSVINEKISSQGVSTGEPILDYGNFSDKITLAAEKIDANMIVIGAGEKLNGDVFVLGSNAEKIIRQSIKPVFVVKNRKQFNIKKIFCPVDFSDESKRALQNAITMTHRFKAELVILSVYEVSHLYLIKNKIDLEEEVEYIRVAHEEKFTSFLEGFELAGLNFFLETAQGAPDVGILKSIEKHNADLLIIGTTGKSGISKVLMGSITEKVIRKVPSSFITLKKEDVIVLELEPEDKSIEDHFKIAQQLFKDGFFEESIKEFKACLDMDFIHLPSLEGLSKVYKELGDSANEKKFSGMMNQVLKKMK